MSAGARSADPGPSAHSRLLYRLTPGSETLHGFPHLLRLSCGWNKLVQKPGDRVKEENGSWLETIELGVDIVNI